MIIGNYIAAAIKASSAMNALISGRIYPVIIPQNDPYPAITYSVVNSPADTGHETAATQDRATVQFNIWASTYASCLAIDTALRTLLDNVSGTAGGVTVTGCDYGGGSDGIDEKLEYFFISSNYEFRYKR